MILVLHFLHRRGAFFATIVLLSVLSTLNLYWFRHEFSVLAGELLGRHDPEVERWQHWAQHYGRLFAMLAPGARIGIQVEGWHSTGLVIERTADGIKVRRALYLRRAHPGVILTVRPDTAETLLASVPGTDPEAIWKKMKDGLYGRQITVWNDPDIGRLYKDGCLSFLRAIDTRPTNVDWPEVKALLGEQ